MIWMFRIDDVLWDQPLKVDDYYLFDEDDINFDITKYDISLYLATSEYFLLSESNDTDVYALMNVGSHINPKRFLVNNKSPHTYKVVKDFYITQKRLNKLKKLDE